MSSGSAGRLAWRAKITAAEGDYVCGSGYGWAGARACITACPPSHHHSTTSHRTTQYHPTPPHHTNTRPTVVVRTGSGSFVRERVAIFEIWALRLSLMRALVVVVVVAVAVAVAAAVACSLVVAATVVAAV